MQEQLGSSSESKFPPPVPEKVLARSSEIKIYEKGHEEPSLELEEIQKGWKVDLTKFSESEKATLIKYVQTTNDTVRFLIATGVEEWGANVRFAIAKALALTENNMKYKAALFTFISDGAGENDRTCETILPKLSEIITAIENQKDVVDKYYKKTDQVTEQQLGQLRKELIKKL